jgi:hypothetical protein
MNKKRLRSKCFQKRFFTFHSCEYISRIHQSQRDMDYIISKGISQISKRHSQIPNSYYKKGNNKFKEPTLYVVIIQEYKSPP